MLWSTRRPWKLANGQSFFATLFPDISSIRAQTGRPHWLIIDEAHHLLPAQREGLGQVLPSDLSAAILITVHPEALAVEILRSIKTVIALGSSAPEVVKMYCEAAGVVAPAGLPEPAEDEVLFYSAGKIAQCITPDRPTQVHLRHTRKYAEGELGPDRSFYFRGPGNVLNLRAQNLMLFLQIGAGVDDETWEFHRRAGHYSDWFRNAIKNDELADEVAEFEADNCRGYVGTTRSGNRSKARPRPCLSLLCRRCHATFPSENGYRLGHAQWSQRLVQ